MSFSENIKDALWNIKKSRKAQITILAILLIGVAATAGYVLFAGGGSTVSTASTNTSPTNTIDAEKSTRRAIDGVLVPVSKANYYPVGVVVENLVAARPQAGLNEANLVYETLVEGGITRFLVVFAAGRDVQKIGPVRSARDVHLDLANELDFLFVHAGGSPTALQALQSSSINDFNQFFHNQYFFHDAERQKTKAIEHTLYTSAELLARALRDTDGPLVGHFDPWLFTDDAPISQRPVEEKTITIDFSSFNYKVGYTYLRESNEYKRFLAEQPHLMENGKEILAKNVVVQYAPTTLADEKGRLTIDMIGEGAAVVFQNGKAINATWKKASKSERTRFFDEAGEEIRFIAGPTWVEVLPNDREVTYT